MVLAERCVKISGSHLRDSEGEETAAEVHAQKLF